MKVLLSFALTVHLTHLSIFPHRTLVNETETRLFRSVRCDSRHDCTEKSATPYKNHQTLTTCSIR